MRWCARPYTVRAWGRIASSGWVAPIRCRRASFRTCSRGAISKSRSIRVEVACKRSPSLAHSSQARIPAMDPGFFFWRHRAPRPGNWPSIVNNLTPCETAGPPRSAKHSVPAASEICGFSSVGRARQCHCRGLRFDPENPPHFVCIWNSPCLR